METFPRCWSLVRGIHRSPMNSQHKGQWRGALVFFICAWINDWVNNREAGDLRRHRAHYDVTVMTLPVLANIPPVATVFLAGGTITSPLESVGFSSTLVVFVVGVSKVVVIITAGLALLATVVEGNGVVFARAVDCALVVVVVVVVLGEVVVAAVVVVARALVVVVGRFVVVGVVVVVSWVVVVAAVVVAAVVGWVVVVVGVVVVVVGCVVVVIGVVVVVVGCVVVVGAVVVVDFVGCVVVVEAVVVVVGRVVVVGWAVVVVVLGAGTGCSESTAACMQAKPETVPGVHWMERHLPVWNIKSVRLHNAYWRISISVSLS